uniref:Uncharacterized protein n=1 Tax=Chlorobium chlorochromatii (strain CaD3) TaxID=340177 RepID=Q3AU29_CHLCH
MATVSVYVSGQTEQNDVIEFFQKGMIGADEHPIAFFEGVFYESHQERVGNIAFQDYLVYTNKAIYLWARGASKDYLDRFNLGAVSINSRNKDRDFATLNLKVRREDKEPIYVIFDMVELREAELITRLHTLVETIIEDRLGLNYRQQIPDEIAVYILHSAKSLCPPQSITFSAGEPNAPQQDSQIGYGQDLLEQYKASLGYPSPEPSPTQAQSRATAAAPEGFSPADALKGLEHLLPTDPAAIKKIAESLKEVIGDAPFKLRDQLKNDLQHVPGMLSAVTELLTSIADNPQAERFVLNLVKTAVKNDGVLGSVSKLMKLSSTFGGDNNSKRRSSSSQQASGRSEQGSASSKRRNESFDDDMPKRKSIHIKQEDDEVILPDCFSGLDLPFEESAPPTPAKKREAEEISGTKISPRKPIVIKADEDAIPSIVKTMSASDTPLPNANNSNDKL